MKKKTFLEFISGNTFIHILISINIQLKLIFHALFYNLGQFYFQFFYDHSIFNIFVIALSNC